MRTNNYFLILILLGGYGCMGKVVQLGEPIRLIVKKSASELENDAVCIWTAPEYEGTDGESMTLDQGNSEEHDYPKPDSKRPAGEWKYKWYGSDSRTDCGIEINGAVEADHGKWKCIFGGTRSVEVTVPYPPKTTILINQRPLDGDTNFMKFNTVIDRTPLNISCLSKKSRPPPSITWKIGGKEIRDELYSIHSESSEGETFMDTEFIMTYIPQAIHDGQRLECLFSHAAKDYSSVSNDESNAPRRYVTLAIEGPPDTGSFRFETEQFNVGEDGILKAFFHSNPPPGNGDVLWRLTGLDEPIVAESKSTRALSSSRYSADLERLNDKEFVSTLTIEDLQEEDLNTEIYFEARNEHGGGSKGITLPEPEVSLSGGTIAGITISVILLVILLGILGLYLYKKRKRSETWTYRSNATS